MSPPDALASDGPTAKAYVFPPGCPKAVVVMDARSISSAGVLVPVLAFSMRKVVNPLYSRSSRTSIRDSMWMYVSRWVSRVRGVTRPSNTSEKSLLPLTSAPVALLHWFAIPGFAPQLMPDAASGMTTLRPSLRVRVAPGSSRFTVLDCHWAAVQLGNGHQYATPPLILFAFWAAMSADGSGNGMRGTRLPISYAVFCLKKNKHKRQDAGARVG